MSFSQSFQMLGPYYIAPGEPQWLGWTYTPGPVYCYPTLVTGGASNVWFTIENTTIMTYADDTTMPEQYTQYGINITNNAEAQDGSEFLEVSVMQLNVW
jgi:hypothetical protein